MAVSTILIVVGVLCIAAAVREIWTGLKYGKFYSIYRYFEYRIDRKREPVTFWSQIAFFAVVGVVLPVLMIVWGITRIAR